MFLTTGLDYTVIGDYLLRKKNVSWQDYMLFRPFLPFHISLHQIQKFDSDRKLNNLFYIKNSYNKAYQREVSAEVFDVLKLVNSEKTIENILNQYGEIEEEKAKDIIHEVIQLWSERLIILRP